jgi:hypothetical protein
MHGKFDPSLAGKERSPNIRQYYVSQFLAIEENYSMIPP